ncbi:Integrase catalytic domain-containing protein [Citrus sinensis]|nr:Integrase catalytic domain-containing protein [Citrus sinensis]
MSFDESLFKEVNKSKVSKVSRVKVGNGQYIEVKGKGTVAIKSSAGIKLISDVLLVPKIDRNLLSLGQLLEKGYSVVFKNNMCVITDPNGVVLFSVKMNSKSFNLSWNKDKSSAYQCTLNHAELWHKWMGHFHYSALDYMQKNDLVQGMTFNRGGASVCGVCQLGKQARLPFPVNKAWRAVEKFQLIHTDVCGPMRTASLNGNKYFMVFIDDFSRMCWVYFLKHKSEVASVFWKFKIWIENQSGCKIKVIKSDNGTEYTADKFAKFCEAAGIEHQLTATYTPQQNRVSERKNRTIMEMARLSRDVKFDEIGGWNWATAEPKQVYAEEKAPELQDDDIIDDEPIRAIEDGIKMIHKNQTWELVDRPLHKKTIGVKWVYKTKLNADGSVNKFKARLVVKGSGDSKVTARDLHWTAKICKEVLKKFNMEDCKSVCTPLAQNEKFNKDDGAEKIDEALYRSIIGCLMYLTATRPDIMFVVSLLSRYMHCASELHYKAAKNVLKYIKGTLDHGIKFEKKDKLILHGFADSDWAGSCDNMRSTSSYLFSLGSGCFCWSSKKQEIVAQSTAKAEYVAAVAAVNQALWLRKLMTDLKMIQDYATEIFVDNQAAVAISNNPVFHGKTKHFKIKYYFVREVQMNDEVRLVYCKTEDQLADILTKGLSKSRFELLKKRIGAAAKIARRSDDNAMFATGFEQK